MAKPDFSHEQKLQFENAANPHSWFLSADLIHDQAVALRSRAGRGQLIYRTKDSAPIAWDETNKATFLLCAVALENAIKSFLVYENPHWISDGYLHPELANHKLAKLSDLSRFIPYQKRDRWILESFEQGNESWMRYPCGRRADDIEMEAHLNDKLWTAYLRVMRGYGGKLRRLLGKGWSGPHEFVGSWEVRGQFLGHPKPGKLESSAPIRV